MPANAKRKDPDLEQDAVPGGRVALRDVAMFSGEELVLRFGASAAQQLVDLIVAAIRKGDDDEVAVEFSKVTFNVSVFYIHHQEMALAREFLQELKQQRDRHVTNETIVKLYNDLSAALDAEEFPEDV